MAKATKKRVKSKPKKRKSLSAIDITIALRRIEETIFYLQQAHQALRKGVM